MEHSSRHGTTPSSRDAGDGGGGWWAEDELRNDTNLQRWGHVEVLSQVEDFHIMGQ